MEERVREMCAILFEPEEIAWWCNRTSRKVPHPQHRRKNGLNLNQNTKHSLEVFTNADFAESWVNPKQEWIPILPSHTLDIFYNLQTASWHGSLRSNWSCLYLARNLSIASSYNQWETQSPSWIYSTNSKQRVSFRSIPRQT